MSGGRTMSRGRATAGTWRGWARGAPVTLPVVMANALVQALLTVGDPTPETGWGFALRVTVSGLAIIVALWLVVGAAAAAVRPDEGFSAPPVRLLAGSALAVLLGVLAGVLSPILPIVIASAALPVLSALAATPRGAARRTLAHSPGRAALAVLGTVLVLLVNWIVALMLAFFVTGPISAALTWVVFGLSATLLAVWWATVHRRAAGA